MNQFAVRPSQLTTRFCLALLLLCSALGLPKTEATDIELNASKLDSLTTFLDGQLESGALPSASLLVMHEGELVYERYTGTLDLDLDTPVRKDSLFRVYSMTKPVTAIATMMLVEQGKLQLDTSIAGVLPEFAELEVYQEKGNIQAKPMTLRHLLSHSSGLTYGYTGNTVVDQMYRKAEIIDNWDYLVPTTHDLVTELGKLPLLFQPGERFHYSFASDVLSQVIERIVDLPFDEHLKNVLWNPLGVEDVYFDVPESVLHRFGTNQFKGSSGDFRVQDSPYRDPEFRDVTFLSGGGGLVMTLSGYARFTQMLVDQGQVDGEQLIARESLEEIFKNQLNPSSKDFKYGLGFGIRTRQSLVEDMQVTELYYWGGAAGSWFWVDLENQLAVVFATQMIGSLGHLTQSIEDLIYAAFE